MGTLKRKNGKLLRKNGKLSCSCCPAEDCCMYPASGLGSDYEAADLPDTLVFYVGVYNFPLILTKDTSGFPTPIYSGSDTDGVTGDAFTASIYDGPSTWDGQYTITPGVGSDNPEIPAGSFHGQECLILGDGNFTPGDDVVEDQFEASYDVSIPYGRNDIYTPTATGTVTRVSLCWWVGTTTDGCVLQLYYGPNDIDDDPDKWYLFWEYYDTVYGCGWASAVTGTKDSPQSSPVGEYIDTSSSSTATVS